MGVGEPTLFYFTTVVTYLHSLFSHFFFEFYIGEEGKESMMDFIERRGRFLVALA